MRWRLSSPFTPWTALTRTGSCTGTSSKLLRIQYVNMECSVKGLSMLMLLSLWLTASYTYVIPSPMDPIEQCIFTCDHCYQSMKLLQCANECVMTDGAMNRHWHKTCPELLLPLFVEVDIDKTPKVMQTK